MAAALAFNHAMIYSTDVKRLRVPGAESTIGLHLLDRGKKLETGGVPFTKPPQVMPWGWKREALKKAKGTR